MYRRAMPAYVIDHDLLAAITSYVRDVQGGVVRRAATALELDYVMLRRFLERGRAKPENRQRIKNALEAVGHGVANGRIVSQNLSLDAIRSMLTQLLDAVEAYRPGAGS